VGNFKFSSGSMDKKLTGDSTCKLNGITAVLCKEDPLVYLSQMTLHYT